jgi:hypothetical protein
MAFRDEISRLNPEQQPYSVISDLDAWISNKPEWQ